MKNKTLTIVLSAVLIGCIGVSIYQYQTTVNLKNELSVLTNTKNELTTEIENKTAELNNITSEIEEANNIISELTANVESLTASSKEIQSEIDTLQKEIAQCESDKFLADSKITAKTSNTENTGNAGTTNTTGKTDTEIKAILDSLGATQGSGGWDTSFGELQHNASGEGIHAE